MEQIARNLVDVVAGFPLGKWSALTDRDALYTEGFREMLTSFGTGRLAKFGGPPHGAGPPVGVGVTLAPKTLYSCVFLWQERQSKRRGTGPDEGFVL
jgi:hypothetical protein